MPKVCSLLTLLLFSLTGNSQLQWVQVDSLFGSLPSSVHVYKATSSLEGKPNIAYYVTADLNDKKLNFTSDTTFDRRLTPEQFYLRNHQPLITVNCTFFSFESNRNLSLLIKKGRTVSYNNHLVALKGKDSLMYAKFFGSALGITKKRRADVAWIYSDSSMQWPIAIESTPIVLKDSISTGSFTQFASHLSKKSIVDYKWKMYTAVGGGPVLVQNGEIRITNNEERKFMGRALNDKHPRTAMGYTADNRLIILVIQGRFPGTAEGATLTQTAQILKDLGCIEALNLDGGGSSCLLVNGKETITPSDNKRQRAVPAVFMISQQ